MSATVNPDTHYLLTFHYLSKTLSLAYKQSSANETFLHKLFVSVLVALRAGLHARSCPEQTPDTSVQSLGDAVEEPIRGTRERGRRKVEK